MIPAAFATGEDLPEQTQGVHGIVDVGAGREIGSLPASPILVSEYSA